METNRILIIGGTGTISGAVMKRLASDPKNEVVVLNRGRKEVPAYVRQITCDVTEAGELANVVSNEHFDIVIDFLVFDAETAARRVKIFRKNIKQYVFISTVVTFNHENTIWLNEQSKQANKYSKYGRNKKAAEDVFMQAYAAGFPVTIVRPSQTYCDDRLPLSVKGKNCWSVVKRIAEGKSVIVHGDGKTLWHMMHADDFAYNFAQLIGNPETIGQSINLVNPQSVSWDMIYSEIGKQLDKKVKICHIASDTLACSGKYNNVEVLLADKQFGNLYSKLALNKYIPDFRCEVSLPEAISRYLAYMNEHEELKVDDPEYDAWCDALIRDYHAFMRIISEKY